MLASPADGSRVGSDRGGAGQLDRGDAGTLYRGDFEVSELNPDGRRLTKVDHVIAAGDGDDSLVLETNRELFALALGERVTVQLLRADAAGTRRADELVAQHRSTEPSGANDPAAVAHTYLLHGDLYERSALDAARSIVLASFGALQMRLEAAVAPTVGIEAVFLVVQRTALTPLPHPPPPHPPAPLLRQPSPHI